ncbi:transcription factor cwo-like [Biomphalaria glabrata]|uniref:Transcription factor cwo-like n=1 Tax=Biomphalaria glabrata TaxID=6526 RepID=A0A9W3A3F0_BIOGL|nr:transcription factor cwo-like [Biomphalaria glabrata]XP_055881701.1 transcription factor cwo-like [Biomphalaria glabrata]XP_055881702.1 transcription factor cwo-like [Biomphalaria glabrata]XP_055881703.1 transcription factor cwo-like [Biomphalaria glabrata]XP_055881704.1 transcription factor cwo-like [Biomphalaria glabrata]XP_055881705.1 transcription factor cwo-like [Biomphalaria glabrata]XP_055881706.1 transcription factor cwo-like [Biomphalaria glabrata]
MDGEDSSQSILDDKPGVKRARLDVPETDRLLNFATAADEFELCLKRQKIPRDPMSHRIIEKRRRDRMNNCLADLSRLIPSSYHKQGQGRIEKTEIIEMAIKHINLLQQRVDQADKDSKDEKVPSTPAQVPPVERCCCATKFYMGFKEAQDEVMRFLVEVESVNAMDPFCKKIMNHLENASQKFITQQISHSAHTNVSQDVLNNDVDKSNLSRMDSEDNRSQSGYRSSCYAPPPFHQDDMSQDSKHRDQRLRSLLDEQQQSNGNLPEIGSRSSSMVPLFSYSNHLNAIVSGSDQNGTGSSGYVSDMSNHEKTSPSGSTSSRDNVYKFKHNITKRFSEEGHHLHHHIHHHGQHHHHGQPSDTSSSTSSRDLEDDQSHIKWKSNKHRIGSSSGIYREDLEDQSRGNNSTNSDEINSLSASSDCSKRRSSKSCNQTASHGGENSSIALPGFILHPQGTHYMPISVHNTNIAGLFENNYEHDGPPVFHPISIPVHFRRPVISMPNITICTHMTTSRKDRNMKD